MINKKKQLPMALLKILQPQLYENLNCIEIIDDHRSVLFLKDKEPGSQFIYQIIEQFQGTDKSVLYYRVVFSPKNDMDNSHHSTTLKADSIQKSIQNWINSVKEFQTIVTVFDNPILESLETYFIEQIEILDIDAEKSSFDIENHSSIRNFLLSIDHSLDELKTSHPQYLLEITELQKLTREINRVAYEIPKKEVINKINGLMGKASSYGIKIMEQVFIKAMAEFIANLPLLLK